MMLYDSYHFALSFIFCNFRPQPRTSFARPLAKNLSVLQQNFKTKKPYSIRKINTFSSGKLPSGAKRTDLEHLLEGFDGNL